MTADDDALELIAGYSSGDCRSAYNTLEVAAQLAQSGEARKAELEVQTRIYRDGTLIYEGKPMVPSLTGEVASGRLLAGGHMVLAEGMSPGDYLMQVTVTDKLAKQKYQSASQAIDFEVRR